MSNENFTKAERLKAVKAIEQHRGDKEFVLSIMRENPLMGPILSILSEELRGDKEVVLEAMKLNINQFKYMSEELQHDEDFIKEVEIVMKETLQDIARSQRRGSFTKDELAKMIKAKLRSSEVQEVIAETEQIAREPLEKKEITETKEQDI